MDITRRRITKIAREVSKFTVRTLRAEGIGTSEFDFIHAVRKNPGITQREICRMLGIDKAAAARRTSSLEAKGYLVRKPNPRDGRSSLLYPQPKADELKNSKAKVEAQFYQWLLEPMSQQQREEFARLLDMVYQRCRQESKDDFKNISRIVREDGCND